MDGYMKRNVLEFTQSGFLLWAMGTLKFRCDNIWVDGIAPTIRDPNCRRCVCCSALTLGPRRGEGDSRGTSIVGCSSGN